MKVQIYGRNYDMNEQLLRRSFSLKELANNKGDASQPQFIIDEKVDTFLDMLQEFRDWYSKPMRITSCFRQKSYNTKVGGDAKSAHLHACAVDWWIPGHDATQRTNVKNKWASLCKKYSVIGAVNYYGNGYHLEAYSDVWYGNKNFVTRDYRGTQSDW